MDTTLPRLRAIETDIQAGRLTQAAAALNALHAASPSDPQIFLTAGMLALAANNPPQQIASLQQAVKLAPRWSPAYIELAKALSRAGRHESAVAAANTAVELAPQSMIALEVAVAVANAAGDVRVAQRHLQSALTLRPDDPSIARTLGMCLAQQGKYAEAESHWRRVLEQFPDDALVLGWLGTCLLGLGKNAEACVLLERAVTLSPDNPSLAFHLALGRGETPPTQPRQMIQDLFDDYAHRFDKHLVGELKYRVPKRVAEIIQQRHPGLDISVLDLGCGTGLLGVYLGRVGGAFIGVDVSSKMLAQAAPHDIYTELRHSDLLDALRQAAADSFDCITANDVFIYVGELSEIIPATFKALRDGGTLIFSCETADESERALVLRPSKRYAHSQRSIEILCREAGFRDCRFEAMVLRYDVDTPINGFIAIAEKRVRIR